MHFVKCKFILVSFVAVFIMSCASVYVPPSDGPKAKLGVNNQEFWSNENIILIFDDPITCKGLHVLAGLENRVNGKPVLIAANQLTTIVNRTLALGSQPVDITLTFYAREHEVYLINTKQAGYHRIELSIIKVGGETNGKIKYAAVPFIKRELKEDFITGFANACTDDALQRKLKEEKNSFGKSGITVEKEFLSQPNTVVLIPMTIAT